jgi:hypothetical protein
MIYSWQDWNNMNQWQVFAIGLGTAAVLLILIFLLVIHQYRSKRIQEHKITVCLDGGVFQGSTQDIIFKAKLGADVDITRILPVKEGYRFNGFNVYKRYVSSTITDNGITKSVVTSQEMDGMGKDVITMPDYDLYLVAKYSPLPELPVQELTDEDYYPDFLVFEDLVADLKHLNYDPEHFPVRLNFRRYDEKFPGMVFVFKGETICAMLMPYKGLTKVFLRTPDPLDDKLLNQFYEAEDINDAMNWYSFIVTYITKPSRFLRTFKEVYDGIDAELPTSEIEFNLIIGSLSTLADPILDRAYAITLKYEEDRLLADPPEYVKKRTLPETFESDSLEKTKIEQEAEAALEKEGEKETEAEEEKPTAEQPAVEEKPFEAEVSQPVVQPETQEFKDAVEVCHQKGYFILPRRKGKFLKWDEGTRAEQIEGVRTYYRFHPEAGECPIGLGTASSSKAEETSQPETQEFKDKVEMCHQQGYFILPRRKGKFLKWDEGTRAEQIEGVKTYYRFHPEAGDCPIGKSGKATVEPKAEIRPTLETKSVAETKPEEPETQEFKDNVEAAHQKGCFILPRRKGKFLKWDEGTRAEQIEGVRTYYRFHPEAGECPIGQNRISETVKTEPKTAAVAPQKPAMAPVAKPVKPVAPLPVHTSVIEDSAKTPMAAPASSFTMTPEQREIVEGCYRKGQFVQPKRGSRYVKWDQATDEEKVGSVKSFFAFHQDAGECPLK